MCRIRGMSDILTFIARLIAVPEIIIITSGIILNTVLAVALAIRSREFRLGELAEFLVSDLLPYALVYVAFRAVGDALDMSWVATAVWAIIVSSITGRIVEKLRALGVRDGSKS